MKTRLKISTALSMATALLFETGCSNSGDSGPDNNVSFTPNTTAPELVGEWRTDCKNTPTSSTTGVVTFTAASGGSGSISSGSTRGDSERTTLTFNQDGSASGLTEYFGATNCNTALTIGTYRFSIAYTVGSGIMANDGSPAIELNLVDGGITTFTIFQVVNSLDLYVGDETRSSPTNDGTSEVTRFDGLGERYNKL